MFIMFEGRLLQLRDTYLKKKRTQRGALIRKRGLILEEGR